MLTRELVSMSMNGDQKKNGQDTQKQFPGCLGRMVNLFDLSNGVAANRLLTDKPHRDGLPLARSRSDVARISSTRDGDQIEDKMMISKLKRSTSNKKGSGTPMKTLIAQEMSKDIEPKNNSPNLVAKLMGLDTLPLQPSNLMEQKSFSKGYSRRSLSHSGLLLENWEQDRRFVDNQMQYDGHCYHENRFKDVYEIWQESEKKSVRDSSPRKGRCNESPNEKRMALVRQKFTEAKRLATDEKGCQSKEFVDAVEVLSSNRDLFLQFLQESNSMFSNHLYDMQATMTPPSETKRITVLRPSKSVDSEKAPYTGDKTEKLTVVSQGPSCDRNIPCYSPAFADHRIDEYPSQPTRIVVLKPTPGKTHDMRAVISTPPSPPRVVREEELFDESEGDEARESREVPKEITRHVRENVMGHRRDETLLSSVFSNGYNGDDSSFVKSENEYITGNLSDSEIMSPVSRHSWDYVNKFGSPYSNSSFSRASCSPESSVCREAKKRLSERWAMMSSNLVSQEQKESRKSSSTLGEMLALSDTKKLERSEEKVSEKEHELKASTSCLTSIVDNVEGAASSPKGLLRSKSLPVSSTGFGGKTNEEVADPDTGKQVVPDELSKAKSTRSFFKGRVSSLFFSRSKQLNKERSSMSRSKSDPQPSFSEQASPSAPPEMASSDVSICGGNKGLVGCIPPALNGSSSKTADTDKMGTGLTHEGDISVVKPEMTGSSTESQDQPSPISVLEPPFEDDSIIPEHSVFFKAGYQGPEITTKSNLIGKSPPIGSISRTLSWDDSCVETSIHIPKPSPVSSEADEEEPDWLFLIETLLSEAGLHVEVQSDSFFARWHSPESPLDPSLREKYANLNDKELMQDAKRRQMRSYRKLVFDRANAALLEIVNENFAEAGSPMLVDYLWDRMKDWFVSEMRWSYEESGDSNSLVVKMLRKEVVGKGWVDSMRVELDNLGKEIQCKLLDELVEETVVDIKIGSRRVS